MGSIEINCISLSDEFGANIFHSLVEEKLRLSTFSVVRVIKTEIFMSFIKACVHYFLPNVYFSLNNSPSKTVKNVFYFIQKALFILKIFKFLYFHLPLFFSLSAIALDVDPR